MERTSRKKPKPQGAILKLKKALRDKALELDLLREISESISCNLDLSSVVNRIIEMVVQVTQADACLLYLYDDRKRELVLKASKNPHGRLMGRIRLELGEGITGWAARERRIVAIPKNASDDPRFKLFHNLPEDRYDAFLSIPVIVRNEVTGVINVQHKRPHSYTESEIALLTTVGQQVGGAIQNAQLYEEMQKKAVQIDTLSAVSRMISSNRYIEEILQLIVTMTAEMMNSKICSVMLLDEEKQELEIVATQSLSEAYRKKPNLKIGQSISGRVVKERQPIAVMDVAQEAGFMYPEIARKEGLCSLLSVPMIFSDQVVGVINVYTSDEYKFPSDEIKILQSVANQAAGAIENTKLVQRSIEMEGALESRKVVERAKGILMKERNISEGDAFKLIQRKSMNSRKSMREISEAILLTYEIQKN